MEEYIDAVLNCKDGDFPILIATNEARAASVIFDYMRDSKRLGDCTFVKSKDQRCVNIGHCKIFVKPIQGVQDVRGHRFSKVFYAGNFENYLRGFIESRIR